MLTELFEIIAGDLGILQMFQGFRPGDFTRRQKDSDAGDEAELLPIDGAFL